MPLKLAFTGTDYVHKIPPCAAQKLPILLLFILLVNIFSACQPVPTPEPTPMPSPTPTPIPLGAGFRYSSYGPPYDPGASYWVHTGQQMAAKFPNAVPATIWIVGILSGNGTYLNFPPGSKAPDIYASSVDANEDILTRFDVMGGQVWLQVEPGNADVETLIHMMLGRYAHHPSVMGVGIDVEWYESITNPEGTAVSDEVAAAWVAAARSHGERFRVFLKHWEIEKMPSTYREGLVFVDDSQQFTSLEHMVAEFTAWGEYFAPAPVAFQFGYPADKNWWESFPDPPAEIGTALLNTISNTEALFWVDFTILDIFPDK
jgi:hypothetical protein